MHIPNRTMGLSCELFKQDCDQLLKFTFINLRAYIQVNYAKYL